MSAHKIALLSTAYLPPVQYLSKFVSYDQVQIDYFEFFRKQTFRNRCVIYSSNGPIILTVPIVHPDKSHKTSKDIRIDYHQPWQKIHCKSIESAYGKSPYFLFYFEELFALLLKKYSFLIELNSALTDFLLNQASIKNTPTFTSEYQVRIGPSVTDYRNTIEPGNNSPDPTFTPARYMQVFENKFGFNSNLSSLDLLFNMGKEMRAILLQSVHR